MIRSVFATELSQFRRDRAAMILCFVLPLAFFSIFAFIFSGTRDATTKKVRMIVVDLDRSPTSRKFVEGLQKETGLTVSTATEQGAAHNEATAEKAVRGGDHPVALFIPRGFGETHFDFGPTQSKPKLQLIADTSDPIAPAVASGLIQKVLVTAMPDETGAAGVRMFRGWSGGLTPQQEKNIQDSMKALEELRAGSPKGNEQVGFFNLTIRDIVGEEKKNPVVSFYAAAIGVMFLLFTSSRAGGSLLDEADSGTLDRVLSSRVSMTTLLLGKLLFLTALGCTQLILMFIFGVVAFDLELFSRITEVVLMTVTTSLAVSAFGLLLATLCRTRSQLHALSTLIVLIISGIGGSMFPRFLLPESVQRFGLIFFNSWALEGFTKVFWRNASVIDIWKELAVLTLTAVVFLLIARVLAKRWEAA